LQNGEAMRRIERFELHQEIERSRAERRTLVEQAAALDRLAFEDPLTHLANRRDLERQWEHSLASGVEHCSLVMLDLDRFKVVNDRFGHAVGDQVLITLAGVLRANARAGDVTARWGGEEFLLFLPALPMPQARDIAERIRLQVEHRDWTDIHADLTLTISAGVVGGPLSSGLDALVQQADETLYRAKAQGRNCVVVGQG
jgi:diguanylate cyclase (GGDEF)-like protein